MRAKSTPLSALLAGIIGSAVMAGCQTYDFEPVDPLAIAQTTKETVITARGSKPDVMLLVDTSGSMTLPVDPERTVNGVKVCHGKDGQGRDYVCEDTLPCDTSVCPTRWSELQAAMGPFLAESGKLVRFGLTTYPAPITVASPSVTQFCAPAAQGESVRVPIPITLDADEDLQAHANTLNAALQAIPNSGANRPRGGTPTSGSLEFTGSLLTSDSAERERIIILLTDGLPNCNDKNQYSGRVNPQECACTLTPSSLCAAEDSPYEMRGCLDKNASVAAVERLKARNISTIVIGFGAETSSGAGPQVLNEMAKAGGFARDCRADIDCGAGDTCDVNTQLCGRAFYQAANQEELAAALKAISEELEPGEPCFISLDPSQLPSDPALIVVYIDGERTLAGPDTWAVGEAGVRFTGSTCTRLEASRPEDPIKVEVRAIREL
ncbi:adventurous gliding motility lipoprotein CglB [Corallococcus sp. BB11-1]|uniref:adventurous gliding motility lipoprotein CglB n=1 Tax=Corallococcus sp. BB11-1 TaxID=2996783 RepID=UPI00226F3F7D|nr:adventurous gliding motility lipoprotein CglB [Corallococcus sp. BB11-1]MCY1036134.1 adventurous gliding motility lipoprotein CglB [Corallococcus sp. BB11-1]